jgi:hypothetical protein
VVEIVDKLILNLSNDPWLKSMVGNPIFAFSGWIFGILSIIVSVFLYFMSKSAVNLVYSRKSENIVSDLESRNAELEVQFRGKKIPNFTSTKILLVNTGKGMLDKIQIAKNNPIKITGTSEIEILDSKIIYEKETANQISLLEEFENGKKLYSINFDYISKDEGCIIQVFHNGKSPKDILIEGKIKGYGKIKQFYFVNKNTVTTDSIQMYLGWRITYFLASGKRGLTVLWVIWTGLILSFTIFTFLNLKIPEFFSVIIYFLTGISLIRFVKFTPSGFELFDE